MFAVGTPASPSSRQSARPNALEHLPGKSGTLDIEMFVVSTRVTVHPGINNDDVRMLRV